MENKPPSVLFLGKTDDICTNQAASFILDNFPENRILFVSKNTHSKSELNSLIRWKWDYIISYLCPWVLPKQLLKRAQKAAINFHPGSPSYPGLGCTNFAIYDEVNEFGVTCHHMEPKVDSGRIIAVDYFKVYKTDTVFTLTQRCYVSILWLFYRIMERILCGWELDRKDPIPWKREAFTREEFDRLFILTPDMDEEEVRRRVKACSYPGWGGAYYQIGDMKFDYTEEK